MIRTRTNSREWASTLALYGRVRRNMSEPEIVNRAGGNACFRAVKETKKAKLGTFPLNATTDPEKGGRTYKQKFFYARAAQRGVKKGAGIKAAATQERNRRRAARGAIAAGFLNPAKHLGRRVSSRVLRGGIEPGGTVSKSRGTKARGGLRRQVARAVNAVEGSGNVAAPAMQRAISHTVADMRSWAIRQLQKEANRFSARRF